MGVFFLILSLLLIVLSLMPFVKNQHWVFRFPEFIKLQLFAFQILACVGLTIYTKKDFLFWAVLAVQFVFVIYHASLLYRFTKLYKNKNPDIKSPKKYKIISANIYQFNQQFHKFNAIIQKEKPDIFLTIESNKDWEVALQDLENDYPYSKKIALENTYGMHLYAKIPFEKTTAHYFVADDIPSIEAHFKTENEEDFVVFCVHPPPPSPTEEATSKERDGDLMCIAKRVKEIKKPTLVIGDFNTVAWSNVSVLFRKNSGLIDGRIGRGILATFHADYWFFRAPLDLVFHSTSIVLKQLNVLGHIGSDHFPISCVFSLSAHSQVQEKETETITQEEKEETSELIEKGKNTTSNNRNVQLQ